MSSRTTPLLAALAASLATAALLAPPRAPAESNLGRVGIAALSIDADAAQALAESQSGAYLGSTASTTTRTHSLPAAPSAGVTFRARANGTSGLRLDPGASDAIVLPAAWGGAQAPDGEYLELRPGASVLLVADAAGNWQAEALSAPFALQTPTPREAHGRLPPMPSAPGLIYGEVYPPSNGTAIGTTWRWNTSGASETSTGTDATGYGAAGIYFSMASGIGANGQAAWNLGGASWNEWVDYLHPLARFHVEFPTAVDANGKRWAVGIGPSGMSNFSGSTYTFTQAGIGLRYASDHSDTDLMWVASEDGAGSFTAVSAHVTDHQASYWVDLDWTAASSVRCTLYNEAGEILSRETLTVDIPTGATVDMIPGASVRVIVGTTAQAVRTYGCWFVGRPDGS